MIKLLVFVLNYFMNQLNEVESRTSFTTRLAENLSSNLAENAKVDSN